MPSARAARRLSLLALAAALAGAGVSPDPARAAPTPTFPESWFGRWTGRATTTGPDGSAPEFAKELEIGPTSTAERWTWTLRFDGPEGKQERPYVLVAKDRAKGLYAIDEGGGVEIAATYVGGALLSQLEVEGARLTTRERVEGLGTPDERMTSELVTTLAGKETVVGGKDGIPKIASWPVVNVQAAVLRRTGAPSPIPPAPPPPTAAPTPAPARGADAGLDALAGLVEGTFSTQAQAATDSTVPDVRLVVARIWPTRTDGPWFYEEQAAAGSLDAPYRQRISRLEHVGGDVYLHHVHLLAAPERAVGAARDLARLAGESPTTIRRLDGCMVVLLRIDETTYRGSTLGPACATSAGGAASATSDVTIAADGLRIRDRGFDADGTPVWAAKVPSVFRRGAASR